MVDMSQFIAARSDQLNADDLLDAPRTITITKVTAAPDAAEQPVSIHYQGDNGKPFKPCKTVRRIMVGVWGKEAANYVGRSMTLYRDPTVAFGGMQVGGIRVSHMSHLEGDKTVALMVTRGRKAPFTIKPLQTPAGGPQTSGEDPAEKWASAYIGKLATFDTTEKLQTFVDEKAKKLAELETARPDLHTRVAEALAKRLGELSPAASGFADDDLTSEDPSAAEQSVDKLIERAKAAETKEALEAIIAEAEPHKTFIPESLQLKLEIAFDIERQRFAEPVA